MLPNRPLDRRGRQSPRTMLFFCGICILLISACVLPLQPQSQTPVVITVLVPAPTSTALAATSISAVRTATVTARPTVLPPSPTLGTPPTPMRPSVSRGAPDGDGMDNFRISLDFNPDYFLRVYVFHSNKPNEIFDAAKDGRGIDSVEFVITSPNQDKTYYDRTEKTAGYCLFGGGEPDCNPWILEGGQYKWKAGGEPVRSGKYGLRVTVTAKNGDIGDWLWNSNSHNPITIEVP